MPERVGLHRPAVDPGQADLLEHLVDPPLAGPAARPGPHRVEQRQVGAPGQVPVRRRALDQRADPRAGPDAAAFGIGSPSSRTVPDVGSTSPSSIRTVVVLPEPLAPRKP